MVFSLLVKIARRLEQNVQQVLTVLHAVFALSAVAFVVSQASLQ